MTDGKHGKHGRDGEPGPRGKDGRPGVAGPRGASDYELACANGFKGTALEWLESLRGPPGMVVRADGPKGERGEIGPMPRHQWDSSKLRFQLDVNKWGDWTDLRGPRGPAGLGGMGPTGLTGPQGPIGLTGPQGPPGTGGSGGGGSYFGLRYFARRYFGERYFPASPESDTSDPPGTDGQVLFNDDGEWGADAGLTYDKAAKTLTITGTPGYGAFAGAANTLTVAGSATGLPVTLAAAGSDVAIPIWIKPKMNVDTIGVGALYVGPVYDPTLFDSQMYGSVAMFVGDNTTAYPNFCVVAAEAAVPAVVFGAHNGPIGARTAIQSGDEIGRVACYGWGATRWMEGGTISVAASGNFTDADAPATMSLQTGYVGQGTTGNVEDRMLLGTFGVNIPNLTASRVVATDASKNLVSVSPPTITGSRGGNAALASLLTELATMGLVVDGTSA